MRRHLENLLQQFFDDHAFIEKVGIDGKRPQGLLNRCWKNTFLNTLRPRQNGRYFADDIFKCIFLNENDRISIKISLKFFPKGRINNIPPLVQIMAWRRPGDKPLSEPMVVRLPTHICVARPQWVNAFEQHWSTLHTFINIHMHL